MKIKCIDNKGNPWFTAGREYRAWYGESGLMSESELDGAFLGSLDNLHGVFEMIEEEKQHPHSDLMLKYAMIAQYDDKPWEHFECSSSRFPQWEQCDDELVFYGNVNYRLKPQEPKIQVGQVWVSKEGIDVELVTSVVTGYVTTRLTLGGNKIHWSFLCSDFLQNFKRKE